MLIIILCLCNCAKDEISLRNKSIPKEEPNIAFSILTKDKLIKNDWSNYGRLFTYGNLMVFKEDGSYTEEFVGEGCGIINSGKYTLVNGILTLNAKRNPSCPVEKFVEKKLCKLIPESPDPFYSESLRCGQSTYYGNPKPVGTIIKIKDTESMIIEPRKVVATTNIMIREKPSIKSKSYNCSQGPDDGYREIPYFPKGQELLLYARSMEKERINNIEDYWYFAQQDLDWYASCSVSDKYTSRVWIFGGYIK